MATTSGNLANLNDAVTLSGINPDTKVVVKVSGAYQAGAQVQFSLSPDGTAANFQPWQGRTLGQYNNSVFTLAANETRFFVFLGVDVGDQFKITLSAVPAGWSGGPIACVITSFKTQGSSA